MSRFVGLGVRVGVRDQTKIKRRSKEPLMAILDITHVALHIPSGFELCRLAALLDVLVHPVICLLEH